MEFKLILDQILNIEGNSQCGDCQVNTQISCVSVNNGTLLCVECGNKHSCYLKKDASKIKTLESIKKWTIEELLYLKNGGNTKFNTYMIKYFPLEESTQIENSKEVIAFNTIRYASMAADIYRLKLDTIVQETSLEVSDLDTDVGRKIKKEFLVEQMFNYDQYKKDKSLEQEIYLEMNTLANNTTSYFQKMDKDMSSNLEKAEISIKKFYHETDEVLSEKINSTTTTIKNKVSGIISSIQEKLK